MDALGNGDFKVFLEAAKLLRNHENIYNNWIYVSEGVYCFYFNSPLFALILIPFSYLPNFIPNLIWLLLNVYFLYRIWQLIIKYFDLKGFDSNSKNLLIVLSFLFTLRFILDNFGMIQMTIYILWSVFESLESFKNKQNFKGGAILALAINIKILPVVLIPYLIYRNQLKPVLITTVFFIIFLFIPSVFFGIGFNNFMLCEWWNVINPLNSEHLIETDLGLHSLTALIPTLLHKTTGEIDCIRNFVDLDIGYVELILNSVRIFFILFTLYFLKNFPFKAARSKTHEIWEISYIILLIPLIFPHQQKYAFVLIFPSVAYVIYFLTSLYKYNHKEYIKSTWKIVVISLIIVFILTTISTDGIIGRELNRITQHYKTITYGTILLLILLAKCDPRYIDKNKTL